MWVRVSYRGREDGWVLTANKRGPILLPAEGGPAAAAKAFDVQEAAFAAAAAAATSADDPAAPQDDGDRPLTGAKPKPKPPALDAGGVNNEELPLNVGGGGKGAWEPPSEFPPGHESGAGAGAGAGAVPPPDAPAREGAGGGGGGGSASASAAEFMTSLG